MNVPEMKLPQNGTAKTDRSPFVSSVSSILGQIYFQRAAK